jgi:O-antigen/teichoic acid export membrane protein
MKTTEHHKIYIGIIISTIFLMAGYLLRYSLNAFLAHHFPPAFYGDFSIATRVLILSATVTLLGTNSSVHRFFSSYLRDKDHVQVSQYLQWNLRFIFRAFIVCVAFGILLFLAMGLLHKLGIKDFATYHLAVYMLWVAPLAALTQLFFNLLIGTGKANLSNFISSLLRNVLMIIFYVTALLFLDVPVNNFLVITIAIIALLLINIVQVWFLSKDLGPTFFSIIKNTKQETNDNMDTSEWKKVSLKLAMSSLIYLIISSLDLIIVETVHPFEDDVGFYAAILMISGLIHLITATCYQSFRPIVNNLLKSAEGIIELKQKLRAANLVFFSLAGGTAILLIIFGHECLAIFGKNYVHVYPVLVISIVGMIFISCATSATILLSYSGGEKILLVINICELIVLIIAGVLLTWWLGIIGTAIATLIAGLTKSILFLTQTYRFTKIKALTFL